MQNEYKYHVFLSARSSPVVEQWVEDYLIKYLTEWLTQELGGETAQLYWYKNYPERTVIEALRGSCCLVAVWSPAYFRSDWCVAEWQSFRMRGEECHKGPNHFVLPILWHDGEKFPPATQGVTAADFKNFTLTGAAFERSERFLYFQIAVQNLAREVALVVGQAPAFDPNRPVLSPKDLERMEKDGADNARLVREIFITDKPKIPRATLAKR